jgi:hypothetical protein
MLPKTKITKQKLDEYYRVLNQTENTMIYMANKKNKITNQVTTNQVTTNQVTLKQQSNLSIKQTCDVSTQTNIE